MAPGVGKRMTQPQPPEMQQALILEYIAANIPTKDSFTEAA